MPESEKSYFVLCNGGSCRCPIVERKENRVTITDDDGGEVTLSVEQFKILLDGGDGILLE